MSSSQRPARLLDPGLCLSLRPMAYPTFFEMYRAAVKNTWTVEEVDFSTDVGDLQKKMTDAERHLIQRLVAFFATGDSIVANNLVLNLYKHLNAPEARMYLSRQLYEEALHVQFYLTLLDTYVPDPEERHRAFAAVETIPSIRKKAEFCMRWLDSVQDLGRLDTREQRKLFLLNLICFAGCVEGLFFFGAFAYVYFLRSRGLLHGLAGGTNWVFRDESAHMAFAFEAVQTIRREEPELFDADLRASLVKMFDEAVDCETQFAEDLLGSGVVGLSVGAVREYLEYCADQRLVTLGMPKLYGTANPLTFMNLQDVQEITNFFERRVSAYQVGVSGEVVLDAAFWNRHWMGAGSTARVVGRFAHAPLTSGLALGLALAACGQSPRLGPGPGDAAGPDAAAPDAAEPEASAPEVSLSPTPGLDPGTVAIHRLNSLEYDNTIRDLLGVEAHARDTFQPDERGQFDNNADAFTINDARYEQYFNSAQAIAQQVFADLGLRARVVQCEPAGPQDTDCTARTIRAFGLRAWRRPLTEDEVGRLVRLHGNELAAGKSFMGAMQSVVTAMLSSVGFLYRVELDPDPALTMPHAVGPYELASRLSYWLWSTMPDGELFRVAASGELVQPSVLVAQLARLLADARSEAFVESFGGQWLGERELLAHQVEPTAFPEWDEALRASMAREMELFFSEFLRGDRPFDQFLNADVNFVDARLARHYGLDATGVGSDPVRVENQNDQRTGYLGLGGFLTMTSYSYRTAPRARTESILQELLCEQVPSEMPPPKPTAETTTGTFRAQAQAIQAMPECADCHRVIDPMGVALEGFDAIGRFRTVDSEGRTLDTHGALVDGRTFSDERQLADLLASDSRFTRCASRMALTYALGRELNPSDTPYVDRLMDVWKGNHLALRKLLEQIVLSEPFRFRHGEGLP